MAQSFPDTARRSTRTDTGTHARVLRDTTRLSRFNTHIDQDSLAFALRPHPYQPNPKKAGLYSAIIPGLGQAYNRQYWKIPIVYGGLAIAGYFIHENLTQYHRYRRAYIEDSNVPNNVDEFKNVYTTDQLKQLQDDYSKYLDLTVLFTGVGYFLQVVDAITSAHLKNFDISRDISMQVRPVATPYSLGIGLAMNFR
jgi:hypothetical protein